MEILLGKTLTELEAIAVENGLAKFASKQIAQWLYTQRVESIDAMTNLSLKAREALKSRYTVGRYAPAKEAVSVDGTRKYLFEACGFVETVYIPDHDRATLCVSTQAGCKMGCRFCMTGTLGFHGHLTAADILNQVFEIDQLAITNNLSPLTNLVFMGEGEPMDNLDAVLRAIEVLTAPWGLAWSPKRITVSSVGLIPGIERFLKECDCHLAISLHNPFAAERELIMPIEKRYPIAEVVKKLKSYDFSHQRRVSFEYICWGGVNDSLRHANELLRLLKGLECRINLIRFHESPLSTNPLPPSNEKQMIWLRDYLTQRGITTTIRQSRGEDILAACGMLVNSLGSGK